MDRQTQFMIISSDHFQEATVLSNFNPLETRLGPWNRNLIRTIQTLSFAEYGYSDSHDLVFNGRRARSVKK